MSYGLRVWSEAGALRVDTTDRTLRLTDTIYIPSRMVPSNGTQYTEQILVPGLDPSRDGAFICGLEAGTLDYESNSAVDGFLPAFAPVPGAVNLTWRGYATEGAYTVRYMACNLMILRAN